MADEFKLVEDFITGSDIAAGLNKALWWSAQNDKPIYAFNVYTLLATLVPIAGSTLICSPEARFIKAFGSTTTTDGDPLVASGTNVDGDTPVKDNVDHPHIFISGGQWGNFDSGPQGGVVFRINSSGAVLRDIVLSKAMGIQFFVHGDDFVIERCSSVLTPDGAGGGIRMAGGNNMRVRDCNIFSSDDCYQFTPGETSGNTITNSSVEGCYGRTNQGALVAFLQSDKAVGADTLAQVSDCAAINVRGFTGGSEQHGGVAFKFYNASSSFPMRGCWVIDSYVEQSGTVPPASPQAGIQILTGLAGLVDCGVRNVTIENRTGPLIAIAPGTHIEGATISQDVDFTADRLFGRRSGESVDADAPIIAAPYASILRLLGVHADVTRNPTSGVVGRALQIGTDVVYRDESVPAGTVGTLIIDDFVATNCAALGSGGLWQFGNIKHGEVRGLSAVPRSTSKPAGIELVTPTSGTGPTNLRFHATDFTNIASGSEIVAWQPAVGNDITDSVAFNDEVVTIAYAGVTPVAITLPRFAPVVQLLAPSTGSVNYTGVTAYPGPGAYRTTVLVPTNATLKKVGGNFALEGDLVGTDKASVTLVWVNSQWREIARTV